jgi:nucleoside-diphosphate-sugar epimerase
MKHVFITGAAGFIGGYVANRFVDEGRHVLALVHRTGSPNLDRLARDGRVTLIHGDATDAAGIRRQLDARLAGSNARLDAIVHCAGRASDVGRRREFRHANLESVSSLAALAAAMDVRRFVFVSTTDVYGLGDFNGESEDELPLRAHPRNPYPEFKIAAEAVVRNALPAARHAIVRPAQVWGVGDRTLTPRIVEFLRASPAIVHFGRWRGRNRWPLAHVKNVAETIFLAAERDEAAGQAINVVDDERTTMDEFYRLLAAVYLPHKTFRTINCPFILGQGMGLILSGLSNLMNLDRPLMDPSFYALYAVSRNLDFSNARMRRLMAAAGRVPFTRAAGLQQLSQAAS